MVSLLCSTQTYLHSFFRIMSKKVRDNELKNYTNLVNYCIIRDKENDAVDFQCCISKEDYAMRLNQATDYAFRMVLYLASLPEGTKITGAALAEKQNIPERFLLKIMRSLTAANIMKSYRGVEGGFALQRAPKDITLFDIIEAVEGQTELQRCLHDVGSCSKGCSGMCSIYAAFAGIQRNLAKQLKSYNFEDLANQEKAIKNAEEAVKAAAAPEEDKAKAE